MFTLHTLISGQIDLSIQIVKPNYSEYVLIVKVSPKAPGKLVEIQFAFLSVHLPRLQKDQQFSCKRTYTETHKHTHTLSMRQKNDLFYCLTFKRLQHVAATTDTAGLQFQGYIYPCLHWSAVTPYDGGQAKSCEEMNISLSLSVTNGPFLVFSC